jgi:glycosyltransferase involved in cell wall biosynthesis
VKVSLIVPLRNESATVVPLLESIRGQDRLPDELVAVDAGSEDDTAALVTTFTAPMPVRLLRTEGLYPGLARNAGAAAAAHAWLAFTDAGVRLAPPWLEALVSGAKAEGADVVFGSFEPICDTFLRRSAAVAYVPRRGPRGIRGPSVASMALTKEAFERAGRFPAFRAAEDLIFIERLLALPLRVAYAPGAVVHWELAPSVGRTFRRFALYSEHNLRAGLERHWHHGVLRHYLLIALVTGGLVVAGAGLWALVAYPLWQVGRAVRSAWQKRGTFAFRTLDPRHVFGAAALLCVIDAATLAGAVAWLRQGRPRAA